MNIKCIGKRKYSYGVLAFNRKSSTHAKVHHFNNDDGHYNYSYNLTGTETELNAIEEFCARLSGHYGKDNPYIRLDCKHQYVAVTAAQANKERFLSFHGKIVNYHPGLDDYKVLQCKNCKDYADNPTFKGFPVDVLGCEFHSKTDEHHKIIIWVHPMPYKKVPPHIVGRDRHLFVDPETESQLISLGFKKTDGYCGCLHDPEKQIFFEYKYLNPLLK